MLTDLSAFNYIINPYSANMENMVSS